jgi:hypothetical protein
MEYPDIAKLPKRKQDWVSGHSDIEKHRAQASARADCKRLITDL